MLPGSDVWLRHLNLRDLLSPSGAGLEGIEMNDMDIQAVQVRPTHNQSVISIFSMILPFP